MILFLKEFPAEMFSLYKNCLVAVVYKYADRQTSQISLGRGASLLLLKSLQIINFLQLKVLTLSA